MLHFGSLQTNIFRKLFVQMEASLIRHSWAVLEMIISWDTDFGFFTFFPFPFNHWERTKCLLQQGKKREEITSNKMDLLMNCEHCGGTIGSLNLTIYKIYMDPDSPESDM